MEPLVLTSRGYLLEAMDPSPSFTFGMSKLGIAFRHFRDTNSLWPLSPGRGTNGDWLQERSINPCVSGMQAQASAFVCWRGMSPMSVP